MTETSVFAKLSDDVVLNIFFKLEHDPRNWARLSCVCTKFSSLIRNTCCKYKCTTTIPSVVSDLLSDSNSTVPGGWSSLHKLAVCCPGLLHSGVLLEHSDFGLHRELGPDIHFSHKHKPSSSKTAPQSHHPVAETEAADCSWSLYDDLLYDTIYNATESQEVVTADVSNEKEKTVIEEDGFVVSKSRKMCRSITADVSNEKEETIIEEGSFVVSKSRKMCRSMRSHLSSGAWNLSREQGNKLLASGLRGDCLYICDWPGCVHIEEKRNYMLFRGIFKNFKRSKVWRTINDGNRSKIDLNCAYCGCKETWDLLSAFCLRRFFGFHDDGEPVVRAYVCENGHVSGAWTDLPLYT